MQADSNTFCQFSKRKRLPFITSYFALHCPVHGLLISLLRQSIMRSPVIWIEGLVRLNLEGEAHHLDRQTLEVRNMEGKEVNGAAVMDRPICST